MTFDDFCEELVKRWYLKLEPLLPGGEPTLVFTLAGEMAAVQLLQMETFLMQQMATAAKSGLFRPGG